MAKPKKVNPDIVIDGVSRPMTDEEYVAYKTVTEEAKIVIDAKLKATRDKEAAIAKFVALGLTEEDLRLAGM
jgi:hypothetical protein